tara:strand:+ start:1318 stop:1446 length:129 start_codon:yes stop_codon:yes gene_type:complete
MTEVVGRTNRTEARVVVKEVGVPVEMLVSKRNRAAKSAGRLM